MLLEHIWKHQKDVLVKGTPLGVLVPKFETVILGQEHTPDGEKWTKGRTEEALKQGLHVYLTNEHGVLFEAKTWEQVTLRESLLWGKGDPKYLQRTIIISSKSLGS